jgi:hypothetical protein
VQVALLFFSQNGCIILIEIEREVMLMAKKTIDIETLTKIIFAECEKDGEPVSMEEAREMAEMEIKSGDLSRYEKSLEPKKKREPKERKVDEDKKYILRNIKCLLEGMLGNHNEEPLVKMKTETELSFSFKGNDYTLKLTKHRKKA